MPRVLAEGDDCTAKRIIALRGLVTKHEDVIQEYKLLQRFLPSATEPMSKRQWESKMFRLREAIRLANDVDN